MPDATTAQIPAHVPPELVRSFPLIIGEYTDEDPFKRLIPLVHEGPAIFYNTKVYPGHGPAWVLRRMDDLRSLYLDTEHYSTKDMAPFAALLGETWAMIPTELDPPEHGVFRTLVNPLFSPKKMEALESKVREAARRYIGKFQARGKCEFMSEFAFPFPVSVFLDLVDLPQERMENFLEWEFMLLHAPDVATLQKGARLVVDYLRGVIDERRLHPKDDFISFAVQAQMQGRKLTDDELVGFCFNLFIGGLDTVSTNMGLHFRHLAENQEHQKRLREDPAFIPTAMEELLRAFAAVTTFRTCIKETQLSGVTIKPGDRVAMCTTLACRDPEFYERPNEVLLDRAPAHLTFASGPHRCIGSHLARRELLIALQEFLSAIPTFQIEPGATIMTHLGGMVQPKTLPLVWKPETVPGCV